VPGDSLDGRKLKRRGVFAFARVFFDAGENTPRPRDEEMFPASCFFFKKRRQAGVLKRLRSISP